MKLARITSAILCLVMCVAALALWIRSHHQEDYACVGVTEHRGLWFISYRGTLFVHFDDIGPDSYFVSTAGSNPVKFVKGFALWWPYDETIYGFLVKAESRHKIFLSIPHWFAAIVTGGFGIAFCLGWFPRFTMRLVLMVTTVVALVFGLMVYKK